MVLPEYGKIGQFAGRPALPAPGNIAVIEEVAATGDVAALYDHFRAHFGRPDVPGILRCFATHQPLLRHMMDLSESLIFAEGSLTRKRKEMIVTLVSAQNLCPHCSDSHGYFLRAHGGFAEVLDAVLTEDWANSSLTAAEQALRNFARTVSAHSHDIRRQDVDTLLCAGWSELQVDDAVHVAALFSTFISSAPSISEGRFT
jgi:uncharacterized peroxidase-related enzyme